MKLKLHLLMVQLLALNLLTHCDTSKKPDQKLVQKAARQLAIHQLDLKKPKTQEIFSKVRAIIADYLDVNDKKTIGLELDLVDDLGTDSLDMVEIFMAVEEELEIELSDAEMYSIRTVSDLVKIVELKI